MPCCREEGYFYYSRTLEGQQYSVHARRRAPAGMGPPTGARQIVSILVLPSKLLRLRAFQPWHQGSYAARMQAWGLMGGCGRVPKWRHEEQTFDSLGVDHAEADAMDESAPEEVLLDENEEAKAYAFYSVGAAEVSPDQAMLAWGEDTVGGEKYALHVKDIASGRLLLSEPIQVLQTFPYK